MTDTTDMEAFVACHNCGVEKPLASAERWMWRAEKREGRARTIAYFCTGCFLGALHDGWVA